ncbi:MAG: hypothetical protein ACOX2A_01620 [Tepidanaerobacteraceae bacterium]|jgi:hypothetical protein
MNWAWLNFIVKVITNEAVLEPLIAVLLGYGVNVYAKNRRFRIIMDITADLVDYIEENYKEWGIKGSEKMDKFLDLFVKEYKKQMGRKPKDIDMETARIRAEAIVQRARRATVGKNR